MRLPRLPAEEWDGRSRAALAGLVHRKRQAPAGARLREAVILRVARRQGSAHKWQHRVAFVTELRVSAAEIEAAGQGKATDVPESLALAAIDEPDDNSMLSDATWDALGEHLDERSRMKLVFTIGGYCLLAMTFNAFGIEPGQEK